MQNPVSAEIPRHREASSTSESSGRIAKASVRQHAFRRSSEASHHSEALRQTVKSALGSHVICACGLSNVVPRNNKVDRVILKDRTHLTTAQPQSTARRPLKDELQEFCAFWS